MRGIGQFREIGCESYTGLFAFAEHVMNLGLWVRVELHLILRGAEFTARTHNRYPHAASGKFNNLLLKAVTHTRRDQVIGNVVSKTGNSRRSRLPKTILNPLERREPFDFFSCEVQSPSAFTTKVTVGVDGFQAEAMV